MEQVVLVDDDNNQIGLTEKATVHTKNTPLHRAFSLFLFNSKGELLLTQRALNKKTFAGVWTNTVCGHLAPGEKIEEAAQRRLREELGIIINITFITSKAKLIGDCSFISDIKFISDYRYRFADKSGIVENEICPILVGYYDGAVKPNPEEVEDYKWVKWETFLQEIKEKPGQYSPWSEEEAEIIAPLI